MSHSSKQGGKKLQTLLRWFDENKVTYNQEAIDIVEQRTTKRGSNLVSADGIGIVARRDLQDEEPLVVIPKTAVISAATSALANIFFDEDVEGNLALYITVMYEMSLAKQSPWYGYLQSLPKRADIPILWDAQARAWLNGTDSYKRIEKDDENFRNEFERLQRLVKEYPSVFVSQNGVDWADFSCFMDVASLVSSRAFSVDIYRGNSMVPFADIFNHKTAGENTHIEGEDMVCPECGEAFGCEHMDGLTERDSEEHGHEHGDCNDCEGCGDDHDDQGSNEEDDDDEEDEEEEEEEKGEELPLLIDENGNEVEEELVAQSSHDDEDGDSDGFEDEESDEEDDEDEDEMIDTLDMVVFTPCKAKSEVFNTYGEHSSEYLLYRYGFCDTQNPFDSVSLDFDTIIQAFTVAVSENRAQQVVQLITRFRDVFVPHHRAKHEDDENESENEDEDEDMDDEDNEDIPMMEDDDDEELEDQDDMPDFSIDAPGHPDINLGALLVLCLAEQSTFDQVFESDSIFRQYFPILRKFWKVFQDKLDGGASAAAALRETNKEATVKKATMALVCRAIFMLSEKRLQQLSDDSAVLGTKPTDPVQLARWENAKQLRSNERKVLQQCIKSYKRI
ncbi:hypothetical protein GGI07_005180, partial [Coemansia sp. Benny D115]